MTRRCLNKQEKQPTQNGSYLQGMKQPKGISRLLRFLRIMGLKLLIINEKDIKIFKKKLDRTIVTSGLIQGFRLNDLFKSLI